jgi:hypothetical protein
MVSCAIRMYTLRFEPLHKGGPFFAYIILASLVFSFGLAHGLKSGWVTLLPETASTETNLLVAVADKWWVPVGKQRYR